MKSRNIKVIDEHNIDRDANILFGIDLEGSEYAVYWIERDEESNNIFVSKVIKNLDNTFNLADIEVELEKESVSKIVKDLISKSVSDEADKLASDSVNLEDGKVVKFIALSFNKEQKLDVKKTYITTVKKEVTKVSEKYYDVVQDNEQVVGNESLVNEVVSDNSQDIFPEILPEVEKTPEVIDGFVVEPITSSLTSEPVSVVEESVVSEIVEEAPVMEAPVVETPAAAPVQSAPIVETPSVVLPESVETSSETLVNDEFVAFGEEASQVEVQPNVVGEPVVSSLVSDVLPLEENVASENVEEAPVMEAPVVETPVAAPVQSAPIVETPSVVLPESVVMTPVMEEVSAPVNETVENKPLVFNASKETNLNAALGEAAKDSTIPVENIDVVRDFGVDTPALEQTPVVAATPVAPAQTIAPMVQPEVQTEPMVLTKKAGFANSKFFMVVAVAFFLASCVFLGYEVFNYFQLTK